MSGQTEKPSVHQHRMEHFIFTSEDFGEPVSEEYTSQQGWLQQKATSINVFNKGQVHVRRFPTIYIPVIHLPNNWIDL